MKYYYKNKRVSAYKYRKIREDLMACAFYNVTETREGDKKTISVERCG